MNQVAKTLPEGYMKDAQGRLVPVEMVSQMDRERDALVREIVAKAQALSESLAKFKGGVMEDIEAFIELSAERYEAKVGGAKGNVTLTSYDGQFKVQRGISEYITFDERLQIAKELIDECIRDWAKESRSEIRALVEDAFKVNKGRIDTARVLGLRRLEITDARWQRAMQAISDSVQVSGSKTYVRIYERVGTSDQYRQVPLDVAAA